MKMTFRFLITLLISVVLSNTSCQPTDYSADINALRASRDSLAAALKITNANLQATNNTMASLSTSVTTIQAQLTVISGQIATLNTQLTATNATVAGHTTTIATIQSQIKTIQDQIAVLNAQQVATKSVVDGLSTTIASIQTQIASILTQVTTLNSQNTTINKALTDISNALALSNNQLNLMVTQLNALLAQVPTLTDIDGNVYNTVIIGNQVWMADNLKATKYRNGDPIPNVIGTTNWASLTNGAYCDFTNNTTFGTTYGHLYNYYSVIDNRELCPSGWHVPTAMEWTELLSYLGNGKIAGEKLKEVGTLYWDSPNTGTNSSGFAARAGSWRGGDGNFYYWPNTVGDWWS